jgi:hypothetical protein
LALALTNLDAGSMPFSLFTLFPQFPSNSKFKFSKIFTIVALISALSTALCPLAAALGFIPFLLVRLVQGVGFAVCFPVIGAVTSAWACLKENGLFNGALTSFIQVNCKEADLAPFKSFNSISLIVSWHRSLRCHCRVLFVPQLDGHLPIMFIH